MKPIIRVQDVSKKYEIGAVEPRTKSTGLSRLLRKLQNPYHKNVDTIWALKDVSFDVSPGEVVGIVGRNGAGKSTLLKILSRVTEPTTGRIELYGRIGSLLEVGTGFHPDLTGRENVFLNGAILGMRRAEIQRKFDEIVAFSEIEKFIDTPVKWYSSGMYVRLAFAVAAHLEPEILILDEVLAVGDSEFQLKCQNKMKKIQNDGATILFVTHSMESMTRVCQRAFLFSNGRIVDEGTSEDIAKEYLAKPRNPVGERIWSDPQEMPGNDVARLLAVRVYDAEGNISERFDISNPISVEMEFEVLQPGYALGPNFHFFNEQRLHMFITTHDWDKSEARPPGRYKSTVHIPGHFFSDGLISVRAQLSTLQPPLVHFQLDDVLVFEIVESPGECSVRGLYDGSMPGVVRPVLPWTTERVNSSPRRMALVGQG